MKDIGTMVRCTVKVNINGLMGQNMKENIEMVKNRELGDFIIRQERYMMVNGITVSHMGRVG
jgi:hypothetical protein